MDKKYIIRGLIATAIFTIFFLIYWFIIGVIYSFFNFQNITFNNWCLALKIKDNLLYSFYLLLATIGGYLLFLLNLRFNSKNTYKIKFRREKSKATKEMKKIEKENLILLNSKVGLVKSKINQHTVIVGGSGYGKTTTAKKIINQLVNKLNQTVIFIDGKGDRDLINEIKLIDSNAFVWTIGGNSVYYY